MKVSMMLTILFYGLVVGIGFAQNTNSGDLRGTVTDTTGAVIPGVSVQVKDVDKGVVKTYVTNAAGLYDTGSITPDHYLLTFTMAGFATFVRGPITLNVSIQTIDAQLKAGSTQQETVVDTDVPLLNTETGSQEATLSSEVMSQLPRPILVRTGRFSQCCCPEPPALPRTLAAPPTPARWPPLMATFPSRAC